MATFEEAEKAVDKLAATAMKVKQERDQFKSILLVILDCVDYTAGNCRANEMVGAVLPREVIERVRLAVRG